MSDQIGVEIGGTFTDLVWIAADGALRTNKVPSTPSNIQQAVLDALSGVGVALNEVGQVVHGSTVATNALLTRRGVAAGLLTTAGFRDIMEIGTHDRTGNIYDILYRKPSSPIPRRMVAEVAERIDAAGRILRPLDREQAWHAASKLLDAGAQAIAVCFLHAYLDPKHELELAELLAERAPGVPVYLSHQVSPEFREYERTITTAVCSFVGPVVGRYVRELDSQLRDAGYQGVLQVMQSSGGVMPAASADAGAVRMMLSGPAAGVRAGVWFAERNGLRDIITIDMGGTSTDVAIAPDLVARSVPELVVDGLPIRTPAVDMVTVGAGGGSIIHTDAGGFLSVGPASAGAIPGPACYGRGGTLPTVTDAQVVAGILRPARFFGGKMALRVDLANAAFAGLGATPAAAADAALRTVNANMAAAVRQVSTARGIDPRSFTLVAYGGGGPLHAAQIADEVGMSRVLIPWSPGLASAFGLLVADMSLDLVRTRLRLLDDDTFGAATLASMRELAEDAARHNGFDPARTRIEYGLDLRYAGQAFELPVWVAAEPHTAADLRARFEDEHRGRYGYARAKLKIECVNLRARVVQPKAAGAIHTPGAAATTAAPDYATVQLGGQTVRASFVAREALAPGEHLAGPAIVEEATATTLVPPGWSAKCLATGDMLLERS
jgi:N-methylhydantoinase A